MSLKLGSTQVKTLVYEAFGLNVLAGISFMYSDVVLAVTMDIIDLCLFSIFDIKECSQRITQQNITAILEHAIIAIFLHKLSMIVIV